MKLKYHKTLTEEKWSSFSRGKQLLMITSELIRAGNWIKKNDFNEVKLCYERALELLSLTVEVIIRNKTEKSSLLKELLRFKEVLLQECINPVPSIKLNNELIKVLVSLNSESFKTFYGFLK